MRRQELLGVFRRNLTSYDCGYFCSRAGPWNRTSVIFCGQRGQAGNRLWKSLSRGCRALSFALSGTKTARTSVHKEKGSGMRIGFIGLGNMGIPMALRLIAAGHELAVWNRTEGRTEPLLREGAIQAGT